MKHRILSAATGATVVGAICLSLSSANAEPGPAVPAATASPKAALAVLRQADTGVDRRSITELATQLGAPAASPFAPAARSSAPAPASIEIDTASSRTSSAPGHVEIAPTFDGSRVCATSDLPNGDHLGSCSLTKSLAEGQTGAFMTSRPAPGSTDPSRVVAVVADDVTGVEFVGAEGGSIRVKPIENVVTLDGARLPSTAIVSHADGSTARVDF